MRQCEFLSIDKKRLLRKMQIFCRKVKIANSEGSSTDIDMRMVANCSVTHFQQLFSHNVFSSRTNRKKVIERQSFVFSPQIAISATVGPITNSPTDLKSLKKVRKHCNSLYIAKHLPFLCYIHINVVLGPPIEGGTLIVSYVAH